MEPITSPKTLEELKELRTPVRNTNRIHHERLSKMQKLAIWITEHVGTMGFFFVIFLWTASWLTWNSIGPKDSRFDPYPAFVLWLFISNMIQIFLMPLIMIGQNLQAAYAEIRAEADFDINIKAETEIETILMHLENQNKMMIEILHSIEEQEKKSGKV